jgi:aspartate-semialdehyde dehydrogenase
MKKYKVAVVGATGAVGREMLKVLEEENFPVEVLLPLASEKSAGSLIEFNGQSIEVKKLDENSFAGVEIALFSAGGSISAKFAPIAAAAGAVVIDNTSHFRMDPQVPLVVPEVNAHVLKNIPKGIVANPNCSTAQMVLPLKALHDAVGIKRVVVSTYQSVAGAGKEGMDELHSQTLDVLNMKPAKTKKFKHQIAFNVIPQIDDFTDNGYTKEEMKMVNETRKILEDESIAVTATCVRVPVFISHSESVNVELKKPLTTAQAREIIAKFPGVEVVDDNKNFVYPMPIHAAGKNPTYVGRIRQDVGNPNAIEMWVVADNLRKGAALNAVQIAQAYIQLKA